MRFMIKESNSACLLAVRKLTILDIEAWPKSHVTVIKGCFLGFPLSSKFLSNA